MRDHKLSIPAGSYVEVFSRGNLCRVKSSPVTLLVETLDSETFVELGEGQAVRVADFTGLRVTNESAAAVVVVLVVGYGSFEDQALSGTVAARIEQGQEISQGAPVAVGTIAGAVIAAAANRRAFHVRNAGAQTVYMGGPGVTPANAAIVLEPGDELREAAGASAEWYAVTQAGASALAVLVIE